jgi:hypothetical protein
MDTVFSHIISKRLSAEYENVATESLAYVLDYSETARRGVMKLLRGIIPDLPSLRFEIQLTEGSIRPDMWGLAENVPRVYVENKFWAGLTENQPVEYLKQLATYLQPSLLLMVAPDARMQTLWRILCGRLLSAGIIQCGPVAPTGGMMFVATQLGPIFALTSWASVLGALELATADDARARADLMQLKALCTAADNDAFQPLSLLELSNQRTPACLIQLGVIAQEAVQLALNENVLSNKRLGHSHNWQFIGRYVYFGGVGAWFGIHFGLWKTHGATPLWLVFHDSAWGRAREVRRLIEPWAERERKFGVPQGRHFAIALDIRVGEEKTLVVRSLVDELKKIAIVLINALPPNPTASVGEEPDEVPE